MSIILMEDFEDFKKELERSVKKKTLEEVSKSLRMKLCDDCNILLTELMLKEVDKK